MKNRKALFLQIFLLVVVSTINLYINSSKYLNYSFDLDEIFAINYANNIDEFRYWNYFNSDLGNPPFFFFLLRVWMQISTSDIWLRILPLIFYYLSIFISMKILKTLKLNKKLQLLAIVSLLGIGFYFYLGFYVRAYSLLLLLSLMTIYYTFNIDLQKSKFDLIKLTLTIFIGLHTHYIYWIFLLFWTLAYIGSLLGNQKQSSKIWQFLLAISLGTLLSLPLINNLISRELFNHGEKYHWWQLSSSKMNPFDIWSMTLKVNKNKMPMNLSALGWILWVIFFLLTLLNFQNNECNKQKLILLFNLLFWATYLVTPLGKFINVIKYIALFVFLLFFSIILIIENFLNKVSFSNHQKKIIYPFFIIFIVIWSLLPMPNTYQVQGGDDWKSVVALVENEYEDYGIILDCLNTPAFDYYGKSNTAIYGTTMLDSGNNCQLPLINNYYKTLNKILLIDTKEIMSGIGIENSYSLVEIKYDYQPIILMTYEKTY